jgi:hypothetical protein
MRAAPKQQLSQLHGTHLYVSPLAAAGAMGSRNQVDRNSRKSNQLLPREAINNAYAELEYGVAWQN